MDLYNSLINYVTTASLINDTILEIGGYIDWNQLVSNNRLQPEASAELSSVKSYWQGLVDAEPDESAKEVIWLRMERNMRHAYHGAERGTIDETQFYTILGITPGVTET